MRTTQTTFYAMLCVYMFFSDLLASIQPFVQQKMVTSLYSYFSYIYNLMLDFMYLHNRKKKLRYETKHIVVGTNFWQFKGTQTIFKKKTQKLKSGTQQQPAKNVTATDNLNAG